MLDTNQKSEELKKIREEVLNLKTSPLYEYRIKNNYFPVIGEGSHDAKIMFVGEAPGQNEAKTARPFCGAAGRVLDELLASISLERKSVYVTNLVKDRPPENRDPEPSEINLYGPFLDKQIEIIQPKVIATLGRHSMKYIFEHYGLSAALASVSKIHGSAYTGKTSYGDITVVALYHPAAALYNGSLREVMKKDFKVLKSHM